MIEIHLLTSLSVDICFIYYTASFSVDSVSEKKNMQGMFFFLFVRMSSHYCRKFKFEIDDLNFV